MAPFSGSIVLYGIGLGVCVCVRGETRWHLEDVPHNGKPFVDKFRHGGSGHLIFQHASMLAESRNILKANPRANIATPVEGPVLWLLLHKCLLPRFLHFIGLMENQMEKNMEK